MRMHANAFLYLHVVSIRLHGILTGLSNVLISKYRENLNAMPSFTVIRHVPWSTFIFSAGQCFLLVFYGFYLLFTTFFDDATDNEHS